MSALYHIIKSLRESSGTNEKIDILKANKDNSTLKEYLKAVYDPAINYYQTKVPTMVAGDLATMDAELIDHLLDTLANRKVTGHAAITLLGGINAVLNEQGQELLGYIIDRSIGAGIGDKILLKVWSDLFFATPYMRCSLIDGKIKEKFDSLKYFYVQTKMDGSYTSLSVKNGKAELFTRNGNKYPDEFSKTFYEDTLEGFVLTGELLVLDRRTRKYLNRQEGNGILNSIMQGTLTDDYDYDVVAWDMLTQAEFKAGRSDVPYEERLNALDTCMEKCDAPVQVVSTWKVKSIAEAYKIYSNHTAQGLEGVVIKNPKSLWKDGTSKDTVKMKIKFTSEYVITGIYEGTGKYRGMLGGFHIQSKDGRIVSDLGSGFSDKERKELFTERAIGCIVEASANDVVSNANDDTLSLSHPVFEAMRYDKTEADTTEYILDALDAMKCI
jgi:DNA ligase-1